MVMEISRNSSRPSRGPLGSAKSQTAAAQGGSTRGNTASKPTGGADQFDKSDLAAQMQALQSHIANLPIVDLQRVQGVQHSIAIGTHQIEPAQVAHKLLSFEAELVTRVVPRRTTAGFLVASFTYDQAAPLGASRLRAYLDGDYVGEATLPAAFGERRGDLVPAVQRAGRGLGSGGHPNASRA